MQMKDIPVAAGREIARRYGYDQVVIIARRVGTAPDPHSEHVTTYGVNPAHCKVAARMGDFIKHKVMQWPAPDGSEHDREDALRFRALSEAADKKDVETAFASAMDEFREQLPGETALEFMRAMVDAAMAADKKAGGQ